MNVESCKRLHVGEREKRRLERGWDTSQKQGERGGGKQKWYQHPWESNVLIEGEEKVDERERGGRFRPAGRIILRWVTLRGLKPGALSDSGQPLWGNDPSTTSSSLRVLRSRPPRRRDGDREWTLPVQPPDVLVSGWDATSSACRYSHNGGPCAASMWELSVTLEQLFMRSVLMTVGCVPPQTTTKR